MLSLRLTSVAARRIHTDVEARQSLQLKPQPQVQAQQEVKVDAPWGQVAAKVWGEPGPSPLIALHDWRDNAASFDHLAPLLNVPTVALDLPGHGLSSPLPAAAQTFSPVNIFTLRYVLRKLGYQKVSLLGHGNGAQLGLLYASLYPDAVSHLVLVDPKQPTPSGDLAGRMGALVDSILENKAPLPVVTDIEHLVASYKQRGLSEEASRVLLQRAARKQDDGYVDTSDPWLDTALFRNLFERTESTLASKIKCPVMSIESDSQQATSEATRQILAKAAASFEHQNVGGNHYAHLEQPEKVAAVLNRFLV
ncbi:Hypothetical predicted protein [Cloeon dipterum]|uniref:AB hydrolase-1 domain-containing protein n=1 Tax=Cloeon dipterum TaxID=197152 RepID=A0A8S1DHN9_9INSE|nr:Hypothetical predicted protein [Cloeon dipterum]